jgi:hypothetical protein
MTTWTSETGQALGAQVPVQVWPLQVEPPLQDAPPLQVAPQPVLLQVLWKQVINHSQVSLTEAQVFATQVGCPLQVGLPTQVAAQE